MIGIRSVLKHCNIVVGFQHNKLTSAEASHYFFGYSARIGGNCGALSVGEGNFISAGISCIVGYFKGLSQTQKAELLKALKKADAGK